MSLLEAQTDFGLNLLRANSYAASQSTIISLISISIALAMCYAGAKNQTANQISQAIAGDAISDDTQMILTNAIYFKGTWEYKFEKNQTAPKTFYLSENREQQVPMMKIIKPFPYYEDNQVQVLGLPYKSQEVFLYVILPKDRFGLSNLLQDITGQKLQNHIQEAHKWHNDNSYTQTYVELPRFKIEAGLSLNDALKKLGITDAFDERSDFSGMTDSRDLYISDVVHKAFIETNEEGSEAAAATGVIMRVTSVEQFRTFHADHPFLYAIATRQGDILFTGTVASFE
uniref:Serpin domain-containing protein n=1 Tax=Acrobeloides nanus TaxID=290746 RepID=A0A914EHG5_9BILA